jgi:hypothetical protein
MWRVKTIVRHALTIASLRLSLVPIHTFTQDDMTTIRIGSALFLIFEVVDLLGIRRPDPEVWDPLSLKVYLTMGFVLGVLELANIFWASLALLQVSVLLVLTSPAGIFTNFVREMGRVPGRSCRRIPVTEPFWVQPSRVFAV